MVGFSELWMPIVLSAALVFVMSSIIHMVLGYHAKDFAAPPNQDALADAMRPFNLQPGDYAMPKPASMKDLGTPEFLEKHRKGPVVIMSVLPNGSVGMGKQLGRWFVYILVVSMFAAYLAGRTHGPATSYLVIFRTVGTVTFASYALATWQPWIWYGKSTRTTLLQTLDGLIFAMLTAGTFGWLWPK